MKNVNNTWTKKR